jgi:tetratricopeptide (TPR) repeat protein
VADEPLNAQRHYALGALLKRLRKDYDGAERCFRTAIELDPQYADAHCSLGRLLYDLSRDLDEAGRCYAAALESAPSHAKAKRNLALLFKARKTGVVVGTGVGRRKSTVPLSPAVAKISI